MSAAAFDIDSFLAKPLVARLATNGPTIRPVWFLWEDGAFWIITGEWSGLPARLATDSKVSLVVDTCDLTSGEVLQVTVTGIASIEPYDDEKAYRKLSRYLGPDRTTWPSRFAAPPTSTTAMVQVVPNRMTTRDLSYRWPTA